MWVASAVPIASYLGSLGFYSSRARWQLVLFLAVVVAVERRAQQWWWAVAVGAVAGYTWLGPGFPLSSSLMAVVWTTVWAVALGFVPPALRPRRSLWATVPFLIVADVALATGQQVRWAGLAAAGAVAVGAVAWVRPRRSDELIDSVQASLERAVLGRAAPLRRVLAANGRFLDRIGRPLGRALGAVVTLPSAVLVTLAWGAHRGAGLDVLAPPTVPTSRWVERPGVDPNPAHLAAGAGPVDPRGAEPTIRRGLAGSLVVVLVAAVVAAVVVPTFSGESDQGCADPRKEDNNGWARIACETDEFVKHGEFDAATAYTFADYDGRYVTVDGGRRVTWRPPPCACRRYTVWWFGGSAAWGWAQRNEFTLPSQVAKAAWRDGVALDVQNYAMPGWVLGQEVRRFADLVADGAELPDLVVFYDGGNDLNGQKDRSKFGRGSDDSAFTFAEAELDSVLANGPFAPTPADGVAIPLTNGTDFTGVARRALRRYSGDVRFGQRFAASLGVESLFAWQPLSGAVASSVAAVGGVDPNDARAWREMLPVARRSLPSDVLDLSESLDGAGRVVLLDLFHTNEYGADLVARAMWPAMQARLTGPDEEGTK